MICLEKTKPNTTKAHIHQSKNVLQHKINTKKLKPGLVASYDIRPGNRQGLLLFWSFITLLLTYSLTYYLLTYLDSAFSALMLLVVWQKGHTACKN